jgi:hypothetical protein
MTFSEVLDIAKTFGASNLSWYGLKARPSSLGCHPVNTVANISKELALENIPGIQNSVSVRHGAIAYASPLSQHEIDSFELIDLSIKIISFDEYAFEDEIVAIIVEPFISTVIDIDDTVKCIISDKEKSIREAFKKSNAFIQRKENTGVFDLAKEYCAVFTEDYLSYLLKQKFSAIY